MMQVSHMIPSHLQLWALLLGVVSKDYYIYRLYLPRQFKAGPLCCKKREKTNYTMHHLCGTLLHANQP